MRSALLCASSAEKIFLFAAPKRLRAFRSCFFTGGVVEGNGSCRACFLRKQPRGGHPLSLLTAFAARFPFLSPAVTSSPGAGEVIPLGDAFALCRKPCRHHQKPSPWGIWHRAAMTERVASNAKAARPGGLAAFLLIKIFYSTSSSAKIHSTSLIWEPLRE